MKIEFVGGARTVTGSSYILTTDRCTIMIDCGMFQGNAALRDRNALGLIYAPKKIDALLLTHAHIDHSGLIPKLVKEGFENKIFATSATVDLCAIMLPDSAHIQESDAEWRTRKQRKRGEPGVEPLYTMADAEKAVQFFVPVRYDDLVDIAPGVRARFRDDGHILGSAFIELMVEDGGTTRTIVFSGDIGSSDQAIIRDPDLPDNADVLFIESTYGDRLHKSKKDTYEEFKNIILESHNRKGNIIIPSFAVERTQEIIYTLGKLFAAGDIPRIPVYIDSPLAINATEVFLRNTAYFDDEMKQLLASGVNPLEFPNLTFVRTTEESIALNKDAKGSIIISASGMCTAGRIKFHLANNLYRPESSVIFVGFQAEGTLGRMLVDGATRVKIYGEDVVVKSRIYTLGGFSGHADRDGLLAWMSRIKNEKLTVFVIHGEERSSLALADSIKERFGYTTYVPRWGEIVDIDTLQSSMAQYGTEAAPTAPPLEGDIERVLGSITGALDRYREAVRNNRADEMRKFESRLAELKAVLQSLEEDQ